MKRPLWAIGIVALIVVLALVLWAAFARSGKKGSLHATINSAVTNPVAFAKSRITGGVGAALTVDSATGDLKVNSVLTGSPAEKAGLRAGDIITQVNGAATKGRKLVENVESIRGFTGGGVTLDVQRDGTNLQFVIHRGSFKSLGIDNPSPKPVW